MKKLLAIAVALAMFMPFSSILAENQNNRGNNDGEIIEIITPEGWSEVRVLSYDQMIAEIAFTEGKLMSQVKAEIPNHPKIYGMSRSSYISTGEAFDVTSEYGVRVVFYMEVEYNSQGYLTDIDRIVNSTLDRTNTHSNSSIKSKHFNGDMYVNLQDSKNIYYWVNGDFYNNGNTTVTGGVSFGVGESGKINFTASNTTNHYAYCFRENTMTLSW